MGCKLVQLWRWYNSIDFLNIVITSMALFINSFCYKICVVQDLMWLDGEATWAQETAMK